MANLIATEDYLDEIARLEAITGVKHEMARGVIAPIGSFDANGFLKTLKPSKAMAGGTFAHSAIVMNIAFAINDHLRLAKSNCEIITSDLAVEPESSTNYFYPDLSIYCSGTNPGSSVRGRDPKVLIEVLSNSTANYDMTYKLEQYKRIESLEQILFVDSTKVWVMTECLLEGDWHIQPILSYAEAMLEIRPIGANLKLAAVYGRFLPEAGRGPLVL